MTLLHCHIADTSSTHLGICPVPEGIKDLLHSHNLACLSVNCFPYDAISLREIQHTGHTSGQPFSMQ